MVQVRKNCSFQANIGERIAVVNKKRHSSVNWIYMMMDLYVDDPFDRKNNNLKFVTLIWEHPV